MKVVCQKSGWDMPTSPAIPITWAMFRHVLSARNSKDKLSWQECAEILATAFSVQSNVYVNRDYSEQTIVLNAIRRIRVAGAGFFAMAIVDVSENNLAP
jgi:aminoglycoside/choline kinase family phosphotransferase